MDNHNKKPFDSKIATLPIFAVYMLVVTGIVIVSVVWSTALPKSDFAQDYLAACAVRDSLDPNLSTTKLAQIYGVPEVTITSLQMTHPPLVTVVAMPFTSLSWKTAHVAWEIFLGIAVGILLLIGRNCLLDTIFLSPVWCFGLAYGNIDGIVICLIILALSSQAPRTKAGIMLGLAAALKVYPVFLILGWGVTRKYQQFLTAVCTGGIVTVAATMLLGSDSLLGWLRYIPRNGNYFAVSAFNISFSKATIGLGLNNSILLILGLGIVLLQVKKDSIEPLLAGMLLIAPTSWLQQLAILSNRLQVKELIGCCVCSLLIISTQIFHISDADFVGRWASSILTCLVLIIYLRLFRTQKISLGPVLKSKKFAQME
ncbi:MAG TPA: glycosyltransferase family 87 protein [Geobacteraceae bacterium]|jgi:hypothetical protein|nr:glycosyltransferase family 87 protein [Geobacteraceae bacterium]